MAVCNWALRSPVAMSRSITKPVIGRSCRPRLSECWVSSATLQGARQSLGVLPAITSTYSETPKMSSVAVSGPIMYTATLVGYRRKLILTGSGPWAKCWLLARWIQYSSPLMMFLTVGPRRSWWKWLCAPAPVPPSRCRPHWIHLSSCFPSRRGGR